MKAFSIPSFYRSDIIGQIKAKRKADDPRKQDFSPSRLDLGPVQVILARHFGFCYGVENAIERAYKALEENKGKRIFLLSQMIHNPAVNQDLQENGIQFVMDTDGSMLFPWEDLSPNDVVLIPAFGTTIEIENKLSQIGLDIQTYNTTCPFVEKVWNRSEKLASDKHTIIIHGKPKHEETRATFSHASAKGHAIVVKDMTESLILAQIISGEKSLESFYDHFADRCTPGFDPVTDLNKLGVVNQTTMLASETQAIAQVFRDAMVEKFGPDQIKDHFADTRDTLCYATNDNQQATMALLEEEADLALVVGGYNSSNTSHIVDLLMEKFPTYFVKDADELISESAIRHYLYHEKELKESQNWLPEKKPLKLVLTSGASCPDSVLEGVLKKVLSFYPELQN